MRVVFFGTPAFAVPSLVTVARAHQVVQVVSQPDRPSGRGQGLSAPPVKLAALDLEIPVFQPATLKDPEVVERLSTLQADAFVVVAYGKLLPQRVLDLPRRGSFNVHGSLLPRYRGAAPIQWAVIREESVTGICIMRMEAGLDTGPVAARAELPIGPDDTAGTLALRLADLGAALLETTLQAVDLGTASFVVQDHAAATLAPQLGKEDGLLDFRKGAIAVSAHARGVDPWPGATARLSSDVVKLFGPRVLDVAPNAPAGTIVSADDKGLVVACGSGAVAFAELQFPGRKRLPAGLAASGRRDLVGARFETQV